MKQAVRSFTLGSYNLLGVEYEIDLSDKHADELRTALGKYIDRARRVGGTSKRMRRGRRAASTVDTTAVRSWAREQGYDIKDRGRMPSDLIAEYQAATGA
jgi:hypothetical protein